MKLYTPQSNEKTVACPGTAEVGDFHPNGIARDRGVRQIPVFVLLPPRLLLLDIAGPLEVLRQANRVQGAVRFDVRYVGPNPELLTSIGITLAAVEPLPSELPSEAWVVLAGDVENVMQHGGGMGDGKSREDESDEAAIVAWLKQTIQPGHRLISICTGALMAARAGLLDGHACTTHYLSCAELATVAPKATFGPSVYKPILCTCGRPISRRLFAPQRC